MHLFKILVVLVATLKIVAAYDTADVRFEVERAGYKRVTIKAFEGTRTLFNQTVDGQFNQALMFGQNTLSRHGNGYKILYRGRDNTSLDLEVDEDGNITLAGQDEGTGFAARKSWGFKTAGTINHTGVSLFYQMFTRAQQFHNQGILKSYTGEFLQDYLFNKGVIHFGNDMDYVDARAYGDYLLSFVNPNAAPTFQNGVIDDHGAIIAEKGLRISNLTHKIHGILDVEQGLELDNASVENTKAMTVAGPLRGTINQFTNRALFTADTLQTNNLRINTLSNTGNIYLARGSALVSEEGWKNTGAVFMGGNGSVGSKRKTESFGAVISEGEIKALIGEALEEAAAHNPFENASFLPKRGKLLIEVLKHTDHYLNTITNHYTVDRWGRRTFTHKTETGYVFQRRTTEKKQVEANDSEGSPELSQAVNDIKQDLQGKRDFLQHFKRSLQEKLKRFGLLTENQNGILAALIKGLSDAGLSDGDIQEIFGRGGAASGLLGLASAYDQMPFENRQRIQSEFPQAGSFFNSLTSHAQRIGLPVWQWAQRSGPEFVEGFCNLAILASRFTPHPAVALPARICTFGQMAPRAIQNLEKAQTFFSKRHGDGGQAPRSEAQKPQSARPHGLYENAPYHHFQSKGLKSPAPTNGQKTLDRSVPYGDQGKRVGVDPQTQEFVVFMNHQEGRYHGHVRKWEELSDPMRRALIDSGKVRVMGSGNTAKIIGE